ncbi:nucleophile aminohydrolase [Amylocarpus encephaloides]|uniref:Nucleophile aminohydrolase n=1 Tax=Amylocarpus encephaloides TaxID=45428 RepID=A0A9P8C4A4_9HELO|nr:nucleophile aminohydrolase [Amylocarpus encephaloides]
MAMQILKAGGTAVDAVEIAIKVLEDKEITNAGFGSNLSIEGIVECDATVVDHLGRSGACGATAQIRNPIHLARIILDASNKPLSLRRVPPNLLVGQGATDFGYEHGIPVVPHEYIVSKNARDRFVRWREDLTRAERGRMTPGTSSATSSQAGDNEILDREYEERVRNQQRRDHMNAIIHGTWNEGQPDSPQQSPSLEKFSAVPPRTSMPRQSMSPTKDLSVPARIHARTSSPDDSPSKRPRYSKNHSGVHSRQRSLLGPNTGRATATVELSKGVRPGSNDGPTSPCTESCVPRGSPCRSFFEGGSTDAPSEPSQTNQDEDMITDTVGAIAIDMYGNMAAGSSSGGIGMKHRGRVGPAALVGIGTAMIPVDDRDRDGVSVAAVTSGTGEHMATTMASQKCAERLYHNTRRAQGGADISATEDEAMESFVMADFMGHSGVRESSSAGAIGVMAVKKTNYGYFLYFAHNTDSFALASMHSNEKYPKCVMSRLGEHGTVVQGARKVRVD